MKGLVQSVAQVNESSKIQISTNQVKTSAEWELMVIARSSIKG